MSFGIMADADADADLANLACEDIFASYCCYAWRAAKARQMWMI